jgi:curved DNA-binding protein CbpA
MTDATPNPYDLLGVQPDAGLSAIRAAYRRRAAELHPDRGGDPIQFMMLTKARDLLLDQETRDRYDKTGVWADGQSSMNEMSKTMTLVSNLFLKVLNEVTDLASIDVVEKMRQDVRAANMQRTMATAQMQSAREKLVDAEGRFMARDGGENLLAAIVRSKIAELDREVERVTASMAVDDKILKFLDNYTYLYERQVLSTRNVRPPSSFFSSSTS